MSFFGGIDLGGTKIEARLFDDTWADVAITRVPTPAQSYESLLDALMSRIDWLREEAGSAALPIGVGAPGLINPATELAFTANLPATGQKLARDVSRRAGQEIPFINDCRAFAVSEALLGAGRSFESVAGLVLGTGVAAGFLSRQVLTHPLNGLAGEVGHCPIPAPTFIGLGLPMLPCGCGRHGCFETMLAGPGLERLAQHLTGEPIAPEQLGVRVLAGDADAIKIYDTWTEIAARLLDLMMMTWDPQCIVLGGGLSRLPDLCGRLNRQVARLAMPGVVVPELALAEGGDSSGARGAALIAAQPYQRKAS